MDDSAAVHLFLPVTLALILFSLGLGLDPDDFRRVLRRRTAVGVGLVGQLLVLPCIALMTAFMADLQPEAAVGLVLLAACPGGAHSNLFANLARGDTALSIGLTALSGLATLGTLPAWVLVAASLFGGGPETVRMPLGSTAATLLGVVALPTLAGMFVRGRHTVWARRLELLCKGIAVALLLLIVVGSVSKNGDLVLEHARAVGGAVVALNLLSMSAGAGLARLARLNGPETMTITLEVGVQNSTVAVGLALTLLGLPFAVPAIVYSLFVYASATILIGIGQILIPPSKKASPRP